MPTQPPSPDYRAYDYAHQIALGFVARIRAMFASTGRAPMATFIFAQKNPTNGENLDPPRLLSLNLSAMIGGFGAGIALDVEREMCQRTDALAVVRVYEARLVANEVTDAGTIVLDAASVDPSEGERVVFVSLEHAAGATGWAMLVGEEGGKEILSEPQEIGAPDLGQETGATTGYFQRKSAEA